MTLKGSINQACAACKYQRRKCVPACALAPYFPPDKHKMFLNVHKLFGVKKIQKLLQVLHPSQRNEAMCSIIYEANVRDRYPVHGCFGVIQFLQNQTQQCEEELYVVHSMLKMYRNQHDHQPISSNDVPLIDFDPVSQLQLGMAHPTNDAQSFYPLNASVTEQHYDPENVVPVSQNHSYSSSSSPYNSTYIDVKYTQLSSMWIQQEGGNDTKNCHDENAMPIQPQLVVTSGSPVFHQDSFQDYDDMHPYFDIADNRQSYIDSKETYDSSPESSIRETTEFTEHVGENDLKNAAAYFTLTSVTVN